MAQQTYRAMWNDLIGSIPRLPPPLAQTLVNRAWHDVSDSRLWSWRFMTGYIVTPNNITTGTADVALGSDLVTMDADATTALNAAQTPPPIFSTENGIGRQFRTASPSSGIPGAIYTIKNWDGAGSLQLDRPYQEATQAGAPYQIYKCYYQAPPADGSSTPDFLRYMSIDNPSSGYSIRKRKLYKSQADLNAVDPQRGAYGTTYVIANYPNDPTSGNIVHEWYPHPVTLQVYKCLYQSVGLDLSDTNPLPLTCPTNLVMQRAYMYGCQWALKQVSVFPELSQTNWILAYNMHKKDYQEELILQIKQDDEISPLKAFTQGEVFDFPLGGSFLQGHDVSSLVGGGLN